MDLGSLIEVLHGLVDDAGLFPPTSLTMADALARHRSVQHPLLSGRFLLPADRVAELAEHLAPDEQLDVHLIGFPQHPGAVETREGVRVLAIEAWEPVPGEMPCYVEGPDPGPCYRKVRCAGILDEDLARFITEAARESRPFKATAGLHRAVRGWDGAGVHGYLNLIVAVAHVLSGGKALNAIRETDASVLADEVRQLSGDQAVAVRWLFHSYGSCDTITPLSDAEELGLA